MKKRCINCDVEFTTRDKRQKYCSKECYHDYASKKQRNQVSVKCDNCGKIFWKYPSQILKKNFCCRECSDDNIHKNHSVICNCDFCGKEMSIAKYRFDSSIHHYCSNSCRANGHSVYNSGENSPNYRKTTYITIKCDQCKKDIQIMASQINRRNKHFCSIQCKNKWQSENVRGENHPNYNPLLTEQDRYKRREYSDYWSFRKEVYERDDYTCRCCGDKKGGNLVAHHLLNFSKYPELRTDINNGITLCSSCHKEFHSLYGTRDNTPNQLKDYIAAKRGGAYYDRLNPDGTIKKGIENGN